MKNIVVIAHNIRSTHNVGSFFRTCDGFGVTHLYLTGYTPYPEMPSDTRLPHERQKITAQIHKTALNAEKTLPSSHHESPQEVIAILHAQGYIVVALEQTADSIPLPTFSPSSDKIALLLGEEIHGITPELLQLTSQTVEIPMVGYKESFNVSVACGIALYQFSILGDALPNVG